MPTVGVQRNSFTTTNNTSFDTMSDLPLKMRVGIRDQWESPRAPIATSIDSLAKTLGYTISPQIQWPTLYATLKDTFIDPGMFVSAVCRIGIAFYGRMLSRIEDAAMADWTDSLLDGMMKRETWALRIEGSDNASLERPSLTWDEDRGFFKIQIPNRKPPGNSIIEAGFDEDLDALFASPYVVSAMGPNMPLPPIPVQPSPPSSAASTSTYSTPPSNLPAIVVDAADDWTEVDNAGEPSSNTPPPPPSKSIDEGPARSTSPNLPSSQSSEGAKVPLAPAKTKRPQSYGLARPTKLFAGPTLNPVMTVDAAGSRVLIHCSHEASLQQLGKYLDKWARIDYNDSLKRPMLTVKMIESAFFDDVIDTIVVEPTYARGAMEPLNPTFILAFVEGVLGYKEEYTNGIRWIFKLYPIRI